MPDRRSDRIKPSPEPSPRSVDRQHRVTVADELVGNVADFCAMPMRREGAAQILKARPRTGCGVHEREHAHLARCHPRKFEYAIQMRLRVEVVGVDEQQMR